MTMTLISILVKPSRWPEAKIVGKVLFLLGVGLLAFSGTSLLAFRDFCTEHSTVILSILVTSFVFILAGESIVNLAGNIEPGMARRMLFLPWLAEPLKPAKAPKILKRGIEHRCAFCGIDFTLPQVSEGQEESQERDFDRLMFGICLGCGKAVCPRCAYMKGLEMKVRSLHCPGCGSFVL
jgi:DNA-directed RNA polymerase subunit RPC12/RpoP